MIDAQNKTTALYSYQNGIGANTEAILNRTLRHILYGDLYDGGGDVEPPQPIGCEGAIDRIMVGAITNGGLIDVYVDDVRVVDESNYMFRLDGIAPALADFDIEVTPYDELGNEITVEDVPGSYYSVNRTLFKNLSDVYKKILIEIIDASPINTNYTPENATFDYDSFTDTTTFCLAPNVPPIK